MDSGALMRQARLARGLTQEEVARRSGTLQPAIARLESGRNSPTVDTLERLLAALGLRLEITTSEVDSGVDRTLIVENLRLSPAERLRKLKEVAHGIARLRDAFTRTRK